MIKLLNKIITYIFIVVLTSSCSEEIISIIDNQQATKPKNNIEKKTEERKNEERKSYNKTNDDRKSFVEPAPNATLLKKPTNFIGMKYAELLTLMGQPNIKRLEHPELVIVYKNNSCVVHFFLMNDIDLNKKRINYIHVDGKKNINNKSCIESFLESK